MTQSRTITILIARTTHKEAPMRMNLKIFGGPLCCFALLAIATITLAAEPQGQLANAAADQDKAAIRALLKQGVNVNAARADGATALLWAAHWNDLETVDLLLHAGAKVNAADDHGVTPLAQAAENASLPMVE